MRDDDRPPQRGDMRRAAWEQFQRAPIDNFLKVGVVALLIREIVGGLLDLVALAQGLVVESIRSLAAILRFVWGFFP